MQNFLALYMGSYDTKEKEWDTLDEATKKQKMDEGMKAWMAWGEEHKDAIVDNGAPIGKTKLVKSSGVSDIKNLVTGYVIVKAESLEEAAKMFENHPHFTIFPGDSVEIMPCLPMPKME